MRHRGALARSLAGLAAAFAVGVASACSLLNPLDGYTGGGAPRDALPETEAPKDVTAPPPPDVEAPDASVTCEGARPPVRGPASAGTGGSTSFVTALSSFEPGDPRDPTLPNTQGYDLDNTCTCPGARSCKPSTGGGVCDFPNGVDNSAGAFFLSILTVLGAANSETSRIRRGADGLLFRVSGYNDLPDDDAVELAIFSTLGLEGVSDASPGFDAGFAPKMDGTDRWTVDSKSLLGGEPYLPIVVDTSAFVRGGVLVATITKAVRVGYYTMPLVGGVLTGRVVKTGSTYAINDGVVAGRLNARDLLTSLETVPNPLASGYLCGDDPLYKNTRDTICANLDVATDQALDGREAPCDATSLAVRFTAVPAVLGAVVTTGVAPRPCGDAWVGVCP